MKTIKKMVEVVQGYEAFDGTHFSDEGECAKYERSAYAAAAMAVKPLVSKETWVETAFDIFCSCSEDEIRVYNIKTPNDLQIVNTYLKAVNCNHDVIPPDFIGQQVAVQSYAYDNDGHILGTRKQLEDKFRALMDKLFGEESCNAEA